MPYSLFKKDGKFCVKNSETGESKGCSDTMDEAKGHMRALYAAESGDKMGKKEIDMLVDATVELFLKQYGGDEEADQPEQTKEDKSYLTESDLMPYYGATSYSELESIQEAEEKLRQIDSMVYTFPQLAYNILKNPDIDDKEKAINNLAAELTTRMGDLKSKAISKREDVSDADKKRAVAEYGNVTYADPKNKKYPIDTTEHIRAAWNYINKSSNAAKYSSSEVASIKRRIVSAWKKKIDKNGPPSAKKEWEYAVEEVSNTIKEAVSSLFDDRSEVEGDEVAFDSDDDMLIWYNKETNQYMWLARYSNNFRDRDNPPEIISADSHRRFVELVDKGLAPLPEAWLWHIPEWKLGQADVVAYDDTGFAIAAGHVNKGCEQVAEWLSKQKDWKVSHGMPPHLIKRDPNDPTIIIEHETREISFLPGKAAANELTGFTVFKEAEMAISDAKKKVLTENLNMPGHLLDQLQKINAQQEKEAEDAELERKENDEEVATEEAVTEEETSTETTETSETGEQEAVETQAEQKETEKAEENVEAKEQTPRYPTVEEVADAVATILKPVVESVENLTTRMGALESKQVDEKKADDERVKELMEGTPMASLSALIAGRVIGNPDAQVDGRTSLAQGPKETKEKTPEKGQTGFPIVDNILSFSGNHKEDS